MGLCLSHKATINLVDNFGVRFDEKVLNWKTELEKSMDTTVSYKCEINFNAICE